MPDLVLNLFFMKLLLFNILVFASLTAMAQSVGRISGEIKNVGGTALTGATIAVTDFQDSLHRKIITSDQDGKFRFTGLAKGSYIISAGYAGYKKYRSGLITIDSGHTSIQLPRIILTSVTGTTLQDITVTSQKKLIEVKIDRTVVNVESMIGAAGADALEVLGRSPGVMVDLNGGITLDGKQGVLVLIDDRPTYMSPQDLADYLRSLPAGVLDRVELMSNPPAKYDATGGAVINIILKKNRTAGFNGNTAVGYTQGVYARKNGSLNLNYRNQNVNVFGNASVSADKTYSLDDTKRFFYKADHSPDYAVFVNNHLLTVTQSWNGRVGMDYFLSPKTTLGFMITGNARPKTDNLTYTGNQYSGPGNLDSANMGLTTTETHWKNAGINLNFQHKFDSTGKTLSIDADHIAYETDGKQDSHNDSYTAAGALKNSNSILLIMPAHVQIDAIKADFTMPLKGGRFDAGIKTSYVRNDNGVNWFNRLPGIDVPDYARTNHFIYKENINAAYLNLGKDWNRWSFQAGLRMENSHATGNQVGNPFVTDSSFTRQFTNVFPTFFLLYKMDKKADHTLVMRYSTRTRRPGYQQLNPFLFYHDRYTYTAGNPSLLPEFSYNLGMEYRYKQYFGLTAGFGKETAMSYPITQAVGELFISRPQNMADRKTIVLIPNLLFNPFKWWNLNMHMLLLYFFDQGTINGIAIPDNHMNEFEVTNQLRFKKGWAAEISGFFPGKQTFGQSQNQSIYRVGAGIQKNLFNNNATIRLKVDDLLGTARNSIGRTIAVNQAEVYNSRENDSRRIGISFSYRFGKDANARKRKHDKGGAEEESGRVN